MKQMTKKTKQILILLALLLVVLIGGTIAYYTSQHAFENEFQVPAPGVAIQERFSPADHWVPGEEKSKEVWFTNTGGQDMLLRFSITAEWAEGSEPKDKDGSALQIDPNDVITLYWNQGNEIRDNQNPPIDFVKSDLTETSDGQKKVYYYYTKVLKAGESTQHVLESVKFSSALSNDGHQHSDYSNTQIDLTITGETVLADAGAVQEQWTETPQVTAVIDASSGEVSWSWK